MTNDSIKLAQLWMSLGIIKDKLDNEIIPVRRLILIGKNLGSER